MADLEKHLRAALLIRSAKGLELTDAGRAYVEAAKAILEQLDEAERAAAGEYTEPRGDLIVTAPVMFGRLHLLPTVTGFLEAYPEHGFRAVWIRPNAGFTGNHVFVANGEMAFDFHGYRCEEALIAHHWAKGRLWWPGWDGALVPLPQDVLVSEAKSKTYDGLWLREPGQFLHHALPRARAFLDRFGPPPG